MSISCVIGVVDETESLSISLDLLLDNTEINQNIEIILVTAPFASIESLEICRKYSRKNSKVKVLAQSLKGIGGAYQQGFKEARGDFIVLMSSDLETDPKLVPRMISTLQNHSEVDIVAISRWLEKDSFHGYSTTLKLLNFLFQKLIRLLYGSELTDFTYAFRAYRKETINQITWTERTHSFFLESLLRPLNNGAQVQEIPGTWSARTQGVRHIEKSSYWHYLKLAIRLRAEKGFL